MVSTSKFIIWYSSIVNSSIVKLPDILEKLLDAKQYSGRIQIYCTINSHRIYISHSGKHFLAPMLLTMVFLKGLCLGITKMYDSNLEVVAYAEKNSLLSPYPPRTAKITKLSYDVHANCQNIYLAIQLYLLYYILVRCS